jgi:hypothetical protein
VREGSKPNGTALGQPADPFIHREPSGACLTDRSKNGLAGPVVLISAVHFVFALWMIVYVFGYLFMPHFGYDTNAPFGLESLRSLAFWVGPDFDSVLARRRRAQKTLLS